MTTARLLLVGALLLAGCSRGDDAAETPPPELTDKFLSSHFLQYLNHQPSLAAGDYRFETAAAGGGAASFTAEIVDDGGASSSASGAVGSSFPVSLASPGGLQVHGTGSAPICFFLTLNGHVVVRAGDSDDSTAACDTGATTLAMDLPRSKTNDASYAQAYYATIDENSDRDTLDKWKAANGFAADDVHVIFRDTKDLGYGRDMHFRQVGGYQYAIYVNNYLVDDLPGVTYGPLNLDAATEQVKRYHIGTNAIEYGPVDADGDGLFDDVTGDNFVDTQDFFPRFYNFSPTPPYERRLTVDLDGKGEKAMPVPCIVCHGGRADALLPAPVNSSPDSRFPRSGDTFAQLQPLDVGTFEFSGKSPWTRAELEPGLKVINQAVYSSYLAFTPGPVGRWDSTLARELLEGWYGGFGLPGTFNDTYVPAGWQPDPNDGSPPAGADGLYRDVLSTNCRTCHLLRGLVHQSDIDFTSWDKFIGYDQRIEDLVFDAGLMPLATLTYENFHESGFLLEMLASFLPNFSHTAGDGSLLLPGRPVAKAGPDRTSTTPVSVSGSASLFADSYSWRIVSQPTGSLPVFSGDAQSARFTLASGIDGVYVFELTVRNGPRASTPDTVTVTVDSAMSPAPSELTFAGHIAPVLASAGCTGCHTDGGNPLPPVLYTAGANRDVYQTVRSLVNFDDPENSRLLLKPSGHHHGGGVAPITGFDLAGNRSNYDLFLNWILEGAVKD